MTYKDRCSKEPVEVGQHPAMTKGYIVKPVLLGGRAKALPLCEGGHIVIYNDADAQLIAEAFNVLHSTNMTPKELLSKIEDKEETIVETMTDMYYETHYKHTKHLGWMYDNCSSNARWSEDELDKRGLIERHPENSYLTRIIKDVK